MITQIDHVVLVVADIDRTIEFYTRVLQMDVEEFEGGRRALRFGGQKFNLQTPASVNHDHAAPGSANLCLLSDWPMKKIVAQLHHEGVEIKVGPEEREGAVGPMLSVYFTDPDGHLIEVSQPLPAR
ncbi:VOC family protein [Pseudooceanicola sp. LIPI14-2-Ac024]|uniref:VOC family protein n=1 Tax=Pseudooceanicola sp. LIPI14-2-Ac024 TaxID=3344875 RepID=UPI0035CFE0FB